MPGHRHRPDPALAAAPGRRRVQRQVDGEQVLDELRGAGQQLPVGADHQRVAVEDQLVLAAHLVAVDDRRAGLGGAAAHQRQPEVVLGPLVRRGVGGDDQVDAGLPGDPARAALDPEVLADGQRDVDPVQPDDRQLGAGHEVAGLVEDAVVGQVPLVVAGHHLAAVQQRRGVARGAPPRVGVARAVVLGVVGVRSTGAGPAPSVCARYPTTTAVSPRPSLGQLGGEVDQRHARWPGRRTPAAPGPRPGSRSASSPGRPPGGRRPRRPAGSSRATRSALPARSPTRVSTWARATRSCTGAVTGHSLVAGSASADHVGAVGLGWSVTPRIGAPTRGPSSSSSGDAHDRSPVLPHRRRPAGACPRWRSRPARPPTAAPPPAAAPATTAQAPAPAGRAGRGQPDPPLDSVDVAPVTPLHVNVGHGRLTAVTVTDDEGASARAAEPGG